MSNVAEAGGMAKSTRWAIARRRAKPALAEHKRPSDKRQRFGAHPHRNWKETLALQDDQA